MPEADYSPPSGDLTAVFYYDVGELYVRRDQLGSTVSAQREDHDVRITFPRYEDFGGGEGPQFDGPRAPREATAGIHGDKDDPGSQHIVRIVQVSVNLGRGLNDAGEGDLLDAAEAIATATVRTALDWARTIGRQPWLSPPYVRPTRAAPAYLVNAAGDESRGHGTMGMVVMMHQGFPDVMGDMRRALSEAPIPEADSLLAEARQAIWPKNDPDTKRAVLLATIALEVKCAEVLLGRAEGSAHDLLRVIYKRHDEAPLSINLQLTKIAQVILGKSLKTPQDGHLLKQVKSLVDRRNGVAHRAEVPSSAEAHEGVAAAEKVFEWLADRATSGDDVLVSPEDPAYLARSDNARRQSR